MRIRYVLLISLLALGFASLAVRGAPAMPWQSVDERWTSAVLNERFESAGDLISGEDAEEWAARARRMNDEHGSLRGLQSDVVGLPAIGDKAVYRKRLTWEDGFASCVLSRERPGGSLGLVSQYDGCERYAAQEPPGFPFSDTFVAGDPPPDMGSEPSGPPGPPGIPGGAPASD